MKASHEHSKNYVIRHEKIVKLQAIVCNTIIYQIKTGNLKLC